MSILIKIWKRAHGTDETMTSIVFGLDRARKEHLQSIQLTLVNHKIHNLWAKRGLKSKTTFSILQYLFWSLTIDWDTTHFLFIRIYSNPILIVWKTIFSQLLLLLHSLQLICCHGKRKTFFTMKVNRKVPKWF